MSRVVICANIQIRKPLVLYNYEDDMKPMNSNIKIDAGWHGAYREKVVEQGFKYKQTNINTDYLIG